MKNYDSDFSSEPRYDEGYYRLNSVPEVLFAIKAECLDTPTDTRTRTTSTESRQKGIIYGLGIIATLLIVGGFQLARSKNVTTPSPQITTSELEIVIAD